MTTEEISERINKIPFSLLLVAYFGYIGFDYYQFKTDPSSDLNVKKAQLESAKTGASKLEAKLKELQEFARKLEQKKIEIRRLWQELQDIKGTLSETMDVPAFMKMAITEAKKTGVTVVSLKPSGNVDKEYYTEQSFTLVFRSVFFQLMVFLDRLSNVTQIVRVDDFAMKPLGSSGDRYVELEGTFEIKTYKYRGSKADSLSGAPPETVQAQSQTQSPAPGTDPAASGAKVKAGAQP